MNFKFYPLRALLLTLLLFGFKERMQAQDILFTKRVENVTAASDGSTANNGDELVYFIEITNLTTQNFVASRLYDNIPAGVSYLANTTRMNGVAYADVSGRMPFAASGNYVRSNGFGIGILAPGQMALIEFHVKVTANGGSIFNNATIDATQNGVSTVQATNTVVTLLSAVGACNVVYQVSPEEDDDNGTSSYIRTVTTTAGANAGKGGATPIYSGPTGSQRWANTTTSINRGTYGDALDACAAIAFDYAANRIYFVNNTAGAPLSYVDLNGGTNKYAYVWKDSALGAPGDVNINRMGMGSDGYCYALTSNGGNLIKFRMKAGNMPEITRLGALINAGSNGSSNDVLTGASSGGGDLFADGSGKLYLIQNNSKMFKINPATRIATYMGMVNPFPGTSQSLAITASGDVYINGAYHDVYKLTLGNMAATKINASNDDVFVSGDYTSCGFPVLASSIIADKSYKNKNGSTTVNGGDTVIYTISVENIGNINAAGVYMYDYIPPSTIYLPGTTKLNNIPVADVGGVMPYAVSGGRLVNTLGETGGIIKPGPTNAAIVTFMVVTEPNKQVCNQSKITLLDADGNVMFVNSSDPTNIGQTPTCFYSDGVLPLTNLKFKGTLKENKSLLTWSMNGDDNVAYYQVEFSDNASVFYTAGKVGGKGLNLTGVNAYEFTDEAHNFAPVRYYRLKVYTKDGGYSYSGIVKLDANGLTVDASPNPFERDINVMVKLNTAEKVRIRLIDMLGKEVYSSTEQLGIGSHSIVIRIPGNLSRGMYVLDVRAGTEQVYQRKLIKK
jgi:uncharacterized repeat protein (TIGR01451 family)